MPTGIRHANNTSAYASLEAAWSGMSLLPCGYGEEVEPYYQGRWNYFRRGVRSTLDQNLWCSLWPSGSFQSADPAAPMTLAGDDCAFGGFRLSFEFTSVALSGTQTTKFIKGNAYDANSVLAAGVVLHPFITSTDAIDGPAVTSALDGSYCAGVYTGGVAHYLVAYKVGSPSDGGGVTANTLTPTNIDGT